MPQAETSETKRIRQISVTNLFGIFNHTIPLKMDERITIIHGPNGFGKTMMLKLLHTLFSQSNQLLRSIPFDEFRVDFEDKTSFRVSKSPQTHQLIGEENTIEREITFHATGRKPYPLRSKLLSKESTSLQLRLIDRLVPYLDRIGPDTWRNLNTSETLSLEDIVERYGDQLSAELTGDRIGMPEWLVNIRESVPMRLIETQRLVSSPKSPKLSKYNKTTRSEYAVTEDSEHLVGEIKKILVESGALAQSLDRTFPVRVLRPTAQQSQVTEDELLDKLKKLEQKRSRLMKLGLLDQETGTAPPIDSEQGINDSTKAVLAVYAEDTEQKLGIFDEVARKIALLTTIINNRFLYKTMAIDKEKGFVFTTKNGTVLPLENLSSGEQHELVLFYELLFRVDPGSLILIDEPELSLHVVWQNQFLHDVQQVTQLTDIDIILATHSPDIINDRRDLLVELRGN